MSLERFGAIAQPQDVEMRLACVFLFAALAFFPTSVSYSQDAIPDFLRGDANDDRVVSVADSHFLFSAPARHTWPGNVRELRNFLARLAVERPERVDVETVDRLKEEQSSPPRSVVPRETSSVPLIRILPSSSAHRCLDSRGGQRTSCRRRFRRVGADLAP